MTQDVQPLTWQKRTNLEEHQQFFSKINEIIDNLAPTVDEAEAAIAQATAAIATANAASAAASAAASQAQTAASTVAGYDTRLTAAEGDITALGTRMTAAESKNSQQDTAIAALQTADGQNVKINGINEYAVGLTGNQDFTGQKRATTQNGLSMRTLANAGNNFEIGSTGLYNHVRMRNYKADGSGYDEHMQIGTDYATATACVGRVLFYAPRTVKGDATEGQTTAGITFSVNNDDTVTVRLTVYKKDGTNANKTIGTFDGTNWS